MDEQVLAAMARWPNVPDVYGWLSLSARGIWHLHPGGHGWDFAPRAPADSASAGPGHRTPGASGTDLSTAPRGEPIGNPQFTAFINRNYAHDDAGQWYFQNGPQRVYVRLDAAPWIIRTARDAQGGLQLVTHANTPFGPVRQWFSDAQGRLYAQGPQGGGLIDGRDMLELIDGLELDPGTIACHTPADIEVALGFVRQPRSSQPRP